MTQTLKIAKWFYNKNMVENIPADEDSKEIAEISIAKVEKETEKAIYIWAFTYELDIVEMWVPKSVVKSEYSAEKKTERTTEDVFFTDIEEAQRFIDEKKAEGKYSMIKAEIGGVRVFYRK